MKWKCNSEGKREAWQASKGWFPLSHCDCDRYLPKWATFPTERLRLRFACYFLLWNRNPIRKNGYRTHSCDCDITIAIASGKGYIDCNVTNFCDVAIAQWERALSPLLSDAGLQHWVANTFLYQPYNRVVKSNLPSHAGYTPENTGHG